MSLRRKEEGSVGMTEEERLRDLAHFIGYIYRFWDKDDPETPADIINQIRFAQEVRREARELEVKRKNESGLSA